MKMHCEEIQKPSMNEQMTNKGDLDLELRTFTILTEGPLLLFETYCETIYG